MNKSRSLPRAKTASPVPANRTFVLSEIRGPVAICTLNRPDVLNALSTEVTAELLSCLEGFDKDSSVRAIIITGGPKAFAAGADIKEMASASAAEMSRRDFLSAWDRYARISKPLIAAVNGFALGGGCELALACDLIVAGEDAIFGQPEISIGVMPGAGGTQRLVRAIGKTRALEFLWTGKRLEARRAFDWGLVNAVVPPSLVMDEALRLAREIAAQPPLAVKAIKSSVYAGLDLDLMGGLKQERRRFYSLFGTKDQKEGMAAFMEKRKPAFTGK